MTPEFSRPYRAETIGDQPRTVAIEADAGERAALAARFGLVAIDVLSADLVLRRDAVGVTARGTVNARVQQACVVTGEPVDATIEEPVALRFTDHLDDGDAEEVELGADDLDTMPIDNGTIDLGEAAAETMALALDPFPRAPGAAAVLKAAGVLTEEEARPANPFAALRDQLGKGD